MITLFGKFVRHLRLDRDIVLKNMADVIGVSTAMLSGVENGKKSIPLDWEDKLVNHYKLDDKQQQQLHEAIVASINQVRVETKQSTYEKKELAVVFARSFDKIDDNTREELMKLLKEVQDSDSGGDS